MPRLCAHFTALQNPRVKQLKVNELHRSVSLLVFFPLLYFPYNQNNDLKLSDRSLKGFFIVVK